MIIKLQIGDKSMAYKITQHRRGTYEEWLALDIVPYEGELIVVEFEDNIRKCKIGDGETPFSKLPYLSDWVVAEFTDKLEDLQELTGSELLNAVAEIDQKIANAYNTLSSDVAGLRSDVDAQVAGLTSNIESIASDLSKVDGVIRTLVEPAVGELDAKYSEELHSIAEQHNTDIAAMSATIEDKAAALISYVDTAVAGTTADFNSALASTKTDIAVDYTDKIAEAEGRLQSDIQDNATAIRQLNTSVENIQSDLTELADSIDTRIDEKVVASETATNASLAEIRDAIGQVYLVIEQLKTEPDDMPEYDMGPSISTDSADLSVITEQLDKLQYKVTLLERGASTTTTTIQNINIELASVVASLTNLLDQQKASSDTFTKAISDLDARSSKADADIIAAMTSHNEEVSKDLAKLTADDIVLYQALYKIKDDLTKKIDTADEVLHQELSEDVAKINQNIGDVKDKLNTRLTNIQAGFVESINNTKTELTKKITNIETVTNEQISLNAEAINNLSTAVVANKTELARSIEAVATDVTLNKASIANNSSAISQVNLTLDNKTAAIEATLNTLGTRIDNQVASAEGRLQAQINETNNTVSQQATIIKAIQDNVRDLLEDIDHKIDTKISDSTTEISDNLVELKSAVKQIKDTLDSTQFGSCDFSDVYASLENFADQLAYLQADDVLLYQIIYRTRDELLGIISSNDESVRADIANYKETIDNDFETLSKTFDDNLTKEKTYLASRINELDAKVTREVSAVYTTNSNKIAENKQAIDDLATTVAANKTEFKNDAAELSERITSTVRNTSNNQTAISQLNTKVANDTALINANISALDTRIDAQANRISSIIALDLQEGDITKVDSELLDIRNGYDGKLHRSAGEAVRQVGNDLVALGSNVQYLRNSLSQYIDSQAVDGLLYDINGEVGLGQPYYLYLKAGNYIIQDSGVQIIGGAGGGPGGGSSSLKVNYITPAEFKITAAEQAKIYFTFEGTDSSGDLIQSASTTWRINGIVVERGTIRQGENFFDASTYITGTTKVHLTVDDGNGSSTTKSWNVQLIELSLTADSFSDKETKPVGEKFTFSFVPVGAVDKVARFFVDGKELIVEGEFPMELSATASGGTEYCQLPAMSYGSHLLEVYLEADISGTTVKSDSIFKDIICYSTTASNKTPVIGATHQKFEVKQYSTTNIIYTVYDPNNAEPTVNIKVDDVIVASNVKITPNGDYGYTPTAVFPYTATNSGKHEIKIICGITEKLIIVDVEDIGISIKPVTTGLAFDFNPATKARSDREWSYDGVNLTVSDNFDWTNGGFIPDYEDGPCFCIKAGSTATISHKLFATDAKDTGKEFKLVFKTKNVANPNAVFLKCLDDDTDPSRVGIEMRAQGANIYGKSDNLELVYSEEDIIEFEFNISKYNGSDNALNLVMGYEDGVPSRPMIYDNTYSFKHSAAKAQPITLGSPDCDLYVYRFKVYDISLDNEKILDNFIADARTAEEMINRFKRNQIYGGNNKLTAEALAEACPWLRVIKISAPRFTASKSDNVGNTIIQQIYGQGRSIDNWVAYDAVHSGQGTSSNNYGAAGRNLDIKVRIVEDDNGNPINTNPFFLLSNNEMVDKVSLTDTSIPVDYFNIKVNIASSNNITNSIIANRYNRFNPYKRPIVESQLIDTGTKDVSGNPVMITPKDTMEFYNCAVFIQETDPDVSTHREFADNDWHFYAIGNIGDSKKTDNTRATDPSDPLECCVEIMDVGLPLSAFPKDTMVAGHFIDDEGTVNITWSKKENLCKLYELVDGDYVVTPDTDIDASKDYFIYVEGAYVKADETQRVKSNLGILYERIYNVSTDTQIDLNKTYYIDATSYIRIPTNELSEYDITTLYERRYVKTEDETVVPGKKYYTEIGIRIKDEVLLGINPKAEGLYEWTGAHVKTSDTAFVLDKGYYNLITEKKSAMDYTMATVERNLFATDENLPNLYECTFTKTADTTVSKVKYYYIEVAGIMQLATGADLVEENLPNLYECTPIKSQDTTIDNSKTYYNRVEELDENKEFVGVYYTNAMGTTTETVKVYTDATEENLKAGKLFEVEYFKSLDSTIASTKDKTYFVDILENDDFSEDYTYGWRYSANKNNREACKRAWIEFYRFVTTSTDEEFKANLGNYFAIDSALYYYLFTTRYCMVDNRAKNTFWHYGKAADGTHKWDLCWDYDNDTSLGLNNYGKQVYRYGLEDTDKDDAGEEIFRQSDSLFFCRIRDLFSTELKRMYQTLESKNAWDAEAFINECDAWQEQFPEELWRLDIERKYIRTYSKSFINGKGDEQFLRDMSNGRMKYQRRQWERNQEQYMASKYQTTAALGDAAHANFRVGRPSGELAVAPNYQFTLTPYNYIYLNVQYGGASPISTRVTELGKKYTLPYSSNSADIINVGSAAAISDFGELYKLYPRTASLQNATRIKSLKLGTDTAGYQNTIFQRFSAGDNNLLEELDLTNLVTYTGALDIHKLINLKTFKAFGTALSSVTFADSGKLNYIELPAVNDITLRRLQYLAAANLKVASYDNVKDLVIEDCPLLSPLTLLESCKNIERVRVNNIDFGTREYSYFTHVVDGVETGLFRLAGLTADGKETENAQLSGTVNIVSLDGAQLNAIKTRYPNLTVTYDNLISYVTFAGTALDPARVDNAADCPDPGYYGEGDAPTDKVKPVKYRDQEFSYNFFGWSETPGIIVNYEGLSDNEATELESADRIAYRVSSLKHIEGDRVLYPVFKAIRNSYIVTFINPTAPIGDQVLEEVSTLYGSDAVYSAAIPEKLDGGASNLYEFIGWYPVATNVTESITCEAQFAVKDQDRIPDGEDDNDTLPGYTFSWLDLTNCVNSDNEPLNGNGLGYTLNNSNNTMSIIGTSNKFNSAVRIPETMTLNGTTYTVISIGGFSDVNNLELMLLPNTIKTIANTCFSHCDRLTDFIIPSSVTYIGESAFRTCAKLTTINIPKNVQTIGSRAFNSCVNLQQFTIDDNNTRFTTLDNGKILLEVDTGKVIQGLSNSRLTRDMTEVRSLSDYCFEGTNIISASIPNGVTIISDNAFSSCKYLSEVELPNSVTDLRSACFAWCDSLTNIELNYGLNTIGTFIFDGCKLENVTIPSSVTSIAKRAFGTMPTLNTVIFEAGIDANGQIKVPEVKEGAFEGCGVTTDTAVEFIVPWTKAQHETSEKLAQPGLGAKYYRVICGDGEVITNVL